MKYLQCFNKDLQREGFLPNADQVQRKRRLNSDYGLSFLVPMDSDDYKEKIALKGHVQDEKGQYYVINGRKRNRDGLKRMVQIDCTHIMFKMVDFKMPYTSYIEEDFGINIITLTNLITAATFGKFVFSIDSVFDVKDIKDFGHGNAMEALVYVIKTYGCEVDPNNFVIHLKAKIGADNGLQYRFKKNIISSSFEDSARGLVTRMYGEMKDGLTFIGLPASNLTADEYTLLNAVPGAIVGGIIQVNYLISPFAGSWSNSTNAFYDGVHIDQNIEDQLELLIATRAALAECEVPSIDITVNAADLFKIDNTEPKPNLGDVAYSIDPLMELNNISARVVELTEYPYQMDKHSDVRLANFMLKDKLDYQAEFDATKRALDDLMSGGKVRTSLFEEFAKQAVIDINNSKTQIIYDGRGIILQSLVNPLHQIVESAEGIYLTIDGGAHALAAITANGIIAERIVGTIGNFVLISADSIVTGALSGINMSIGIGNDVFKATSMGIQLGHANWLSAPFRVDMAGNAYAFTMTLPNPIITNGSIVGTTLNVNGNFIVDSMGHLTAVSGNFSGNIDATSGYLGSLTVIGTLTGGTLSGNSISGGTISTSNVMNVGNRINFSAGGAQAINFASGGIQFDTDNSSLLLQATNAISLQGSICYYNGTQIARVGSTGAASVPDGHNHGFSNTDYIQCYDSAGNPTSKKQWVGYTGSAPHSHAQT